MFLHSMKPMQKVKTLRLFGGESARNKYRLMKATPNATTLVIAESRLSVEKELIDFWAIAKYLPKLESIGWMVCRMRYEDLLHSLDSCITGFPEILCRKVSAKFFNKDHLTAEELAYYKPNRYVVPSIKFLRGELDDQIKIEKNSIFLVYFRIEATGRELLLQLG